MARTFTFLLILCSVAITRPAASAELIADLSRHRVSITTGFTGSNVLLFGAIEGKGEVVVIVSGPPENAVVRRKARIGGVWINNARMTLRNVPSYYAIAASRPIKDLVTNVMARTERIGASYLRPSNWTKLDRSKRDSFLKALVRGREREGLFRARAAKVRFLGSKLFRTTIHFPANVPTGKYSVKVMMIQNREIVSATTTPLEVSKAGIGARVFEFAHRNSIWYGLIAILLAVMAGWGAGELFRRR